LPDVAGCRELAVGLSHGDLNGGLIDGFSTEFGPMLSFQDRTATQNLGA
jgi:hypothetical protein